MEITKIIGIGIIGTFFAVTVRNYRPELGIAVAAATGLVIFSLIVPLIGEVVEDLSSLCVQGGIDSGYFKMIIKIIGIAYVTQFAAELAKDAGEGAISKKTELAGKTLIVAVMMPAVKDLMDIIINALMSF